jgi:hypothetical protein
LPPLHISTNIKKEPIRHQPIHEHAFAVGIHTQFLQWQFRHNKCSLSTVAASTDAVHLLLVHLYSKHKADTSALAQCTCDLRALTPPLAQTVDEGFEPMPIRWLKHAVSHPLKRKGFNLAELNSRDISIK